MSSVPADSERYRAREPKLGGIMAEGFMTDDGSDGWGRGHMASAAIIVAAIITTIGVIIAAVINSGKDDSSPLQTPPTTSAAVLSPTAPAAGPIQCLIEKPADRSAVPALVEVTGTISQDLGGGIAWLFVRAPDGIYYRIDRINTNRTPGSAPFAVGGVGIGETVDFGNYIIQVVVASGSAAQQIDAIQSDARGDYAIPRLPVGANPLCSREVHR